MTASIADIAKAVALDTDANVRQVSRVLGAALDEMARLIVEDNEEITLPGLGRLKIIVVKPHKNTWLGGDEFQQREYRRVMFRASHRLRDALRKHDTDDRNTAN
jgi:nucleoid DNA-binding protein